MPRVNRFTRCVAQAVEQAEIRGTALSVGRSLLAFATLATILFSADSALFVQTNEHPLGMRCGGIRAVSMWCATGGSDTGLVLCRVMAVVVLVVVLAGFRPRWTCIPHWYVTFSLASAMPIPNGGDNVAQIAALLLVPMCLGDHRRWQWEAVVGQLTPSWRGSALAAHFVLRVQIVIVYATAVWWKLADPLWQQGSAMHVISRIPQFGFPAPLREALGPLLDSYWPVALLSWSIIAGQVAIAMSVLARRRFRVLGLVLGVVLHGGIIFLMNLMSFGLIMIAVLLVASARTTRTTRIAQPGVELTERISS